MKKTAFLILMIALATALSSCMLIDAMMDDRTAEAQASATPRPTPTPTLSPEPTPSPVDAMLASMTLREKVSQLFFLPLGISSQEAEDVWFREPGEGLQAYVQDTQAGGYILFADNITTQSGTKELVNATVAASGVAPFIGIDEEGGSVSRLTSAKLEGYENQPPAEKIGGIADPQDAYNAGYTIAGALRHMNINVDFAPVADVLTNPDNEVIGSRSYGSDPLVVAEMASTFQRALLDRGILPAPKHFPGHGGTSGDTHKGSAASTDTPQQVQATYDIYARLIEEGAPFILVGHISIPSIVPDETPASLSPYFITDVLREQLGFEGVVITDAMNMQAITDHYPPAEASVAALSAGADMILAPENFDQVVEGVLAAVEKGDLSEQRIDQSVRRILQAKLEHGVVAS